jgi:molecular chaperone HtpG
VIGQFGIGFLSGFVVGSKVEVRTRHVEATRDEGCLWENDGSKDYTVHNIDLDTVGTEVTVFLRSDEDRGLLHDDAVKQVVRKYADMLRIPIHINDPAHRSQPTNARHMPWERSGIPPDEMELDCRIYLERTVPDSVLEVIPVHETGNNGGRINGLLYITRTRVIGQDVPRVIRVFQKRMFLCEGAKEILPPWATFVNGILDTPDLSPNAARDNFAHDEIFERIRDVLADVIVRHFERLREGDPDRLSEILAYHDLSIKAACHYYEPFFEKFWHLLEWRINAKSPAANGSRRGGKDGFLYGPDADANHAWATIPDILAALPDVGPGGAKKLPCFQQRSSANQYFDMADAAQSTVVDASALFESELLKSFSTRQGGNLALVFVDREDDPSVFKDADRDSDRPVIRLATVMSSFIRPGGSGRLRVEARRFEPSSLPAVLKSTEASQGALKARGILSDPNSPADLRKMAEDLLRLSRNADMRMTINCTNDLVQKLSQLDPDDEDVRDLMMSVYNDAVLYNVEMMTPQSARLFHAQFQRLVSRSLEFVSQRTEISAIRAELAREREKLRPIKRRERDHKVAFLMTPFSEQFKPTREAVRRVVEDHFGCELRTADEQTYAQFIHGNVQVHIDEADFFIADLTGQNPNVMLELGAALYGGKAALTLLLARVDRSDDKPDLPADLQGAIAATYVASEDVSATAARLTRQFEGHTQLMDLLPPESRDRYVSEESLAEILRGHGIALPGSVIQNLGRALPTRRSWQRVSEEQVNKILGQYDDLTRSVMRRVREHLGA